MQNHIGNIRVYYNAMDVNNCPTRCNYIQFIIISCKLLYMFSAIPSPIIRSTCKL